MYSTIDTIPELEHRYAEDSAKLKAAFDIEYKNLRCFFQQFPRVFSVESFFDYAWSSQETRDLTLYIQETLQQWRAAYYPLEKLKLGYSYLQKRRATAGEYAQTIARELQAQTAYFPLFENRVQNAFDSIRKSKAQSLQAKQLQYEEKQAYFTDRYQQRLRALTPRMEDSVPPCAKLSWQRKPNNPPRSPTLSLASVMSVAPAPASVPHAPTPPQVTLEARAQEKENSFKALKELQGALSTAMQAETCLPVVSIVAVDPEALHPLLAISDLKDAYQTFLEAQNLGDLHVMKERYASEAFFFLQCLCAWYSLRNAPGQSKLLEGFIDTLNNFFVFPAVLRRLKTNDFPVKIAELRWFQGAREAYRAEQIARGSQAWPQLIAEDAILFELQEIVKKAPAAPPPPEWRFPLQPSAQPESPAYSATHQ